MKNIQGFSNQRWKIFVPRVDGDLSLTDPGQPPPSAVRAWLLLLGSGRGPPAGGFVYGLWNSFTLYVGKASVRREGGGAGRQDHSSASDGGRRQPEVPRATDWQDEMRT